MMDIAATQVIQSELRPGEQLVWADMPDPLRCATRDITTFLFGIVFFAFSIFWIVKASAGPDAIFPLFGVPFVIAGAGLVLSPLWKWYVGQRTTYGISAQRLIIVSHSIRRRVQSFTPTMISDVERIDGRNGRGDVVFGKESRYSYEGGWAYKKIGFWGIANVRAVEQLVVKLKQS
jgi:hypothetical protein